jgi:hypothetical protein
MFVQGSDFVLNGQGHGQVGETLSGCRYDPGLLRPYFDNQNNRCVTVNTGRMVYDNKLKRHVPVYEKAFIQDLQARGINSPVFNATALRKEEWIMLDQQVLRAARLRTRAWADLAATNTFGGFNGMSKLILEHETMSDPGMAVVDMDGLTEGRNDSPKFQLEGLPLPITHSDFWFSARRLSVSRNTGTPLDTTMGEAAGRRVAEMVEKVTIGVDTGVTYGGASTFGGYGRSSSVYGYTNFPSRITKTNMTAPTAGGWTPATTLAEILSLRSRLYANRFYGPFMVYYSDDWDTYLDNDYILTGGNVATQTLRDRIKAIDGIQDVRRLDFLASTATAAGYPERITTSHPFTIIMVQMTADVARAVVGMDITTVQWESIGGMRVNFKVMCILVPQIRADFNGNAGVAHGSTS